MQSIQAAGLLPQAAPALRPDLGGIGLRVGVFGTGVLGRHHTRLLSQLPGARLIGVHDPRLESAEVVAQEFGTRVWPDADALAAEIDAAVVASPTVTHAELAVRLLERGGQGEG